jgi:8-oxo-dGTP pyrophosphatase MutT (NUDIX family)
MSASRRYTARAVITARDSQGSLFTVVIRDKDKMSRSGGTYDAFPGGGNQEGEFPFLTVTREVNEEVGISTNHALGQPRELGTVHLCQPNRPPHDVYFFEMRFPYAYLEETLRAIKDGEMGKKEKNISAVLVRAPLDPRDVLGTHYAHLRQVAPELHRQLFS